MKTNLNLGSQGCHHEKIPWILTQDPCINRKYFVTGPSKQDSKGLHKSILVPFRTTKDCHSCRSLLLVWHICSLDSNLDMYSFVETLSIWLWWSNVKILSTVEGFFGSSPGCEVYFFLHADILGRLGSNLVFIVPFGTSYVEFGAEVWLVPFGIM
jgi:hypothetical protein